MALQNLYISVILVRHVIFRRLEFWGACGHCCRWGKQTTSPLHASSAIQRFI